jgi:hypothetical protein
MWTFLVARLPQRLGAPPDDRLRAEPESRDFRLGANAGLSGSAPPKRPIGKRLCVIPCGSANPATKKEVPMLYALLAYHVEVDVASWTPAEDAAVMTDLHRVHDRLNQNGRLGPAARLGWTKKARTLRGPGAGLAIDGPFAETKEQLLGFYILDCATEEAAIEAARDLRRVNPSAVYEIRPVSLYTPGVAFPRTEAAADDQAGGI